MGKCAGMFSRIAFSFMSERGVEIRSSGLERKVLEMFEVGPYDRPEVLQSAKPQKHSHSLKHSLITTKRSFLVIGMN